MPRRTSEPAVIVRMIKGKPKANDESIRVYMAWQKIEKQLVNERANYQKLLRASGAVANANFNAAIQASADKIRAYEAQAELGQKKFESIPIQHESFKQATDDADISDRVISFGYEDDEKKTDVARIQLDNRDLYFFDTPIMLVNTSLIVSWGYPGNMAEPRTLIIQKVSGSLQLNVEAHDKGVLMHKAARTRTFDGMKRSDVVKVIAKEHGYGDTTMFVEDSKIKIDTLTQAAQTDAQFIKKMADQEGFEFFVDVDGLHWHRRQVQKAPLLEFWYYLPPKHGDIISFSISADVKAKPGKVKVKGRDPVKKKDIDEEGSADKAVADVLGAVQAIEEDLQDVIAAFADTSEYEFGFQLNRESSKSKSKEPPSSTDVRSTSEPTASGAKREAAGIYRRTQQTAVELSVTLIGNPRVFAKSIVVIGGLGERLSGKYYVASAKHTWGSNTQTVLKLKSDGYNKPPGKTTKKRKLNTKKLAGEQKGDDQDEPDALQHQPVLDANPYTSEYAYYSQARIVPDTEGHDE